MRKEIEAAVSSILPLFSKAFKKLIYEHFASLLEKANVLAHAQCLFTNLAQCCWRYLTKKDIPY